MAARRAAEGFVRGPLVDGGRAVDGRRGGDLGEVGGVAEAAGARSVALQLRVPTDAALERVVDERRVGVDEAPFSSGAAAGSPARRAAGEAAAVLERVGTVEALLAAILDG